MLYSILHITSHTKVTASSVAESSWNNLVIFGGSVRRCAEVGEQRWERWGEGVKVRSMGRGGLSFLPYIAMMLEPNW